MAKTLRQAKPGESAVITKVGGEGAIRQHFLDMGLVPGTEAEVIKYAPMGDPVEIMIRGYSLTLRLEEADKIEIKPMLRVEDEDEIKKRDETARPPRKLDIGGLIGRRLDSEHPGFGEGGRFHPKGSGDPIPEGETISFALVGNQNSGKTTLFNKLTGSSAHVGNFPGVTVERKTGEIKGHPGTQITDLPGIYSMSPYSSEEIVSRDFVLKGKPSGIINIVDATNIERNLYLTMQLIEMDVPMVVALNMMDEIAANGGSVDINKMEAMLGVPVIPISAAKDQGITELVDHAIHVAYYRERPMRQDFCDENDNGGAVHRSIHGICHLIEDHAIKAGIPVRFAANKVIEGDDLLISQLGLDSNELETIEHIVVQMEQERGLDRSASIADMRFAFITELAKETVKKPAESRERVLSERLDRVLTGKYTAIPLFIAIMGAVFWLTFNVIGAFLQGLLETGIDALTQSVDAVLTAGNVNPAVHGLITEGIFAGVGSVLSFLPIIVVLFFFLSILEDSGYIARVAFVMDKLLRKIGLSGRSIVPILIGFGCTVPAVMSTRTLPSERDRKMTILLTPFASCTAKIPIYSFFVSSFFPGKGGLIMTGLYVLGILVGIVVALIFKRTLFSGEAVPFVMELPNYRMPGAGNVMKLLWEKAKDFLERAFSIILIATIIIWLLQSFDMHFNMVADKGDSILAMVAGWIAPVMKPIGLGDWRICVSLISGFMAKESVVATMQILFGAGITTVLTKLTAASMLVFSLLYTPCVAAVASVKRELGAKWAAGLVLWQCGVAWIVSFIVMLIGSAIGLG